MNAPITVACALFVLGCKPTIPEPAPAGATVEELRRENATLRELSAQALFHAKHGEWVSKEKYDALKLDREGLAPMLGVYAERISVLQGQVDELKRTSTRPTSEPAH